MIFEFHDTGGGCGNPRVRTASRFSAADSLSSAMDDPNGQENADYEAAHESSGFDNAEGQDRVHDREAADAGDPGSADLDRQAPEQASGDARPSSAGLVVAG